MRFFEISSIIYTHGFKMKMNKVATFGRAEAKEAGYSKQLVFFFWVSSPLLLFSHECYAMEFDRG